MFISKDIMDLTAIIQVLSVQVVGQDYKKQTQWVDTISSEVAMTKDIITT